MAKQSVGSASDQVLSAPGPIFRGKIEAINIKALTWFATHTAVAASKAIMKSLNWGRRPVHGVFEDESYGNAS
jgi:hypothetical protein